MERIRVAIVGVGNCASALVQGIYYYRQRSAEEAIGLMHATIGPYRPGDIEIVAAFDIDRRKVGLDVSEAIFAPPNCAAIFQADVPATGARVSMGRLLDSYGEHMESWPEGERPIPAAIAEPSREEVVGMLKASGAHVMANYLPVGSEAATRFYAECALEAGVAFVNNIPVFIASDPEWADRFAARKVPLIGDDIKSQLGATIVHRALAHLFRQRGVKIDHTYQLNTAGNTDFLNMLDRARLASKKVSKTEAVRSVAQAQLGADDVHIGPSDYVPWQKDNKVCFIRLEGRLFGDVAMNLELRLSVEDSPNSAGVAIDAIRCCKLALDRGQGGVLEGPAAYFCKHPPFQYPDDEAHRMTEAFIDALAAEATQSTGT